MLWPLIVAHRGYSARAPENTLAALQMAIESGAVACECDVRRAADGTIVLMHDPTVDRTTSGTGAVAEYTAAELAALDAGSWKSPEFTGEPVPTLRQALEVVHGRATLVVELKEDGLAEAVAADIRSVGAEEEVVIIAFSLDACREAREAMPTVAVLWLIGGQPQPPHRLIDQTLAAGLQGLDVYHGLIDPAFAEAAARRGIVLWAWTVNEPEEAGRLASMGVAAITTDDPQLIAAALS